MHATKCSLKYRIPTLIICPFCGIHGYILTSEGLTSSHFGSKKSGRKAIEAGYDSDLLTKEEVRMLQNLVSSSNLPDEDSDIAYDNMIRLYAIKLKEESFGFFDCLDCIGLFSTMDDGQYRYLM